MPVTPPAAITTADLASDTLPALPNSPSEEDLGHASRWADIEPEETPKKSNKGKGKLVQSSSSSELSEDDDDTYLPDPEETKRIEENLRQWENADRERRRVARESIGPTSPTVVSNVAQRASLLWPTTRGRSGSMGGLGAHTQLPSRESVDVVPMDTLAVSPRVSSSSSADSGSRPQQNNPFSDPIRPLPSEPVSPFADTAIPDKSPRPPSIESPPAAKRHSTRTSSPSSSFPSTQPIPRPIDLPSPVSPPLIDRPPEPHRAPTTARHQSPDPPDPPRTRWWHEWLCGCGEGSDRGGDNQAGRTNPFE